MKIIVTGGVGFLGSHLCDRLIHLGHQVVCVDNLSKGSVNNIQHLRSNKNFTFLKFDVTNKLPLKLKADQVYHLASMASPNPFKKKNIHAFPFETMSVNTTGTWRLCEFAVKNNAQFLFASTSEVYGDPMQHPQKESYNGNLSTTSPRAVYNEAKRFGETITATFVRSKKLNGRIVRIFNTYGPKMTLDDGRVVIEFIVCALQNKPITIFGKGSQTRSFCYVSDMIEGLLRAMNKKNTSGEVFNLGNPQEISVLDLARKIVSLTQSKSKITYQPFPLQEREQAMRRCPDVSYAKKNLGWVPKVGLEEGLTKMIAFYSSAFSLK